MPGRRLSSSSSLRSSLKEYSLNRKLLYLDLLLAPVELQLSARRSVLVVVGMTTLKEFSSEDRMETRAADPGVPGESDIDLREEESLGVEKQGCFGVALRRLRGLRLARRGLRRGLRV